MPARCLSAFAKRPSAFAITSRSGKAGLWSLLLRRGMPDNMAQAGLARRGADYAGSLPGTRSRAPLIDRGASTKAFQLIPLICVIIGLLRPPEKARPKQAWDRV